MTALSDAITALSPTHYWKMDTSAGDLTMPDSVGSFNLTSLINNGGGAVGPEPGTTAQRLYSDQIWTTPAFSQSGFVTQTWMFVFTVPANAVPASTQDVLGFGDPTNRTVRGWRIQQSSSGVGNATMRLQGVTSAALGGAIGAPASNWHYVTWVVQPTSPMLQIGFDGAAFGTQVGAQSGAPQTTDRLWIQSAYPIVMAHLALFPRVLNLTELAGVTGAMPVWPSGQPVNQPGGGGGGGGGLTEDQAAQLDDIHTKVQDIPGIDAAVIYISDTINHVKGITDDTNTKVGQLQTDVGNIVNTLFPQLATVLNDLGAGINDILNGITTTITTAAGSVTQKIGDFFSQHSKDVFGLSNATGGPTCDRVDLDVSNSHFWGVMVHITTRPPMYWRQTPDKDWSYPDMAVITIQRGGFDIHRQAVHGTWETIAPLPEALPEGVAGIAVPVLPQNYHIIVDWAFGVCGEVLLQYIP